MFRTTSLLGASPVGRSTRPVVLAQRLAIGSQIRAQQQQLRVFSSTDQSTQKGDACPSRGQLELSSSKLCLQHCKRLRADEKSVDNALSLVWLKRAELEMRKAVQSFGPDLPQSPIQPMIEQHMQELESFCEKLDSTTGTSESTTEFAINPDEEEYVHKGGALGKAVAEGILSGVVSVLGERSRVPLEYLVRRPAIYRANDRILFNNGAEGRTPQKLRQFHKIWALGCGHHVATYPISEFLLGAEMAFGALFQSIHSGDFKSLEPMLSEDLFAAFPAQNSTEDLLEGVVSHADTGGYEVEEYFIASMEASEIMIAGVEKKILAIEVTFTCKSYVDVDVEGSTMLVKLREEPECVPITLTFFSPLPWEIPGAKDTIGSTDFTWRIATIDAQHLTYLDANK